MFYGTLVEISPQPLAKGGFGLIYKGAWKLATRSTAVAIKVPRSAEELQRAAGEGTPAISTSNIVAHLEREVNTWGRLQHPYIAPLIAYCFDATPTLIMPWYANGNFWAYSRINADAATKVKLFRQTAQAVDFLHRQTPPIVHSDLKPDNVLIDDEGNARLSNFGLAAFARYQRRPDGEYCAVGTWGYQSPETLWGQPLDTPADVFSFGCFMVMVFCKKTPMLTEKKVGQLTFSLSDGNNLSGDIYRNLPGALRVIAEDCMLRLPENRPSMASVASRLGLI